MQKHEAHRHNLLGYALFFIGLIFLIEAIVLIFVLSQIPPAMLGSTSSVAMVYAIIKFLAGMLAIYTGLVHGQVK
jgi:hypothetical protein